MKFKVSVTELQNALRVMRDVAPTTGPLADTASTKVVVSDNEANFYTFSPEMMAKATVDVHSDRDGEAAVDPAAIYSAVSHFKPKESCGVGTGDVSVLLAPKSKKLQVTARTTYASGVVTPHKRIFSLKTAGRFPDLPPDSKIKLRLDVPASIFTEGVSSVGYATASDQLQFIFTGMLLELADNKFTLFATNGVCLAEYTALIPFTGDPIRLVIPGAFAQKVAKSFSETDRVTCLFTRNMLYVQSLTLTLGGSLIGEEYPNYREVLPTPTDFIEIDKSVFLDNLLSLSYEASLLDENRVSVSISNGEVFLRCGQSENAGIPAKSTSSVEFDCNLRLLASSIKNVFGDQVKIGFAGKGKPLTFYSAGDISGPTLKSVLVPLST